MAPGSSILAWKIPWTEEPGGPVGVAELDTTEHIHTHTIGYSMQSFLRRSWFQEPLSGLACHRILFGESY